MLDPANRSALTEELAPPRGHRLVHAVGTTFTLDLNAALAVPLAFTGYGSDEDEDDAAPGEERMSVIAALMSVSEKIDIFAQAGAMGAGQPSELFELLGPMIHQVSPPRGIFHPKVWLLEFENDRGERAHRLLCSSRNLTFDRTWDAMVRLDGVPADSPEAAESAREQNVPLVAMLEHMSSESMVVGTLPEERRRRLLEFAGRLSSTVWDTTGLSSLRFQAFGVPGQTAPEPEPDGALTLVVSPFLTPEGLSLLTRGARSRRWGEAHVVSRGESFDALGSRALEGLRTWVLSPSADDAEEDVGLSGLHAKMVSLSGRNRHRLLLGSSNATGPGWSTNVELMVDVESGRDAYFPGRLRESMQAMLVEYVPENADPQEEDPREDELERLQRAALRLAAVPMRIRVSGEGPYRAEVSAPEQELPAGVRSVSWHLLLDSSLGADGLPTEEHPAVFEEVPLRSITPFVRLTAEGDGGQCSIVLLADLHGDPPERREAIIAARLADPQKLLQLIMMLLDISGAGSSGGQLLEPAENGDGGWGGGGGSFPGLLEALLRALSAGPAGMAEVQKVLDHIRRSPEGTDLPDDFLALWDAAWEAHRTENLGEAA